MNIKHTIVLSHLSSLAKAASDADLKTNAHAVSTRTLFNALEPVDQGELGGIDYVAKTIDYMSRKGLVENGLSEIANGRTVLTWVITDKGQRAIDGEANSTTAQADETIKPEAINADPDTCIDEAIKPQLLTLDPEHPQDRIFIDIITKVKTADTVKPAHKIQRKDIKIDTLNRLAGLMSDDIAVVLGDIASDLARFESEAA